MTDEAIREGFRTIRPGSDYDGLYRSAVCRSQADWLVGMNATRAFTLRYDTLLSVGRVQTPTLAILVKRYQEIANFKPEGFCTVTAPFGDYRGSGLGRGLILIPISRKRPRRRLLRAVQGPDRPGAFRRDQP